MSAEYQGKLISGVRVIEDAANSWMGTRVVWNQHAYSITNINDDLTVPASFDIIGMDTIVFALRI